MVDVEGVRIFPRAPELFGGAVAMDGHGSVHALHVRVQAAPNGHLRFAWRNTVGVFSAPWRVSESWGYPNSWMIYVMENRWLEHG